MTRYEIIEQLADGLLAINRVDGGRTDRTTWGRTTVRKPHVCVVTGRQIAIGESAYRPISNSNYRYERIAADVVDGAIA